MKNKFARIVYRLMTDDEIRERATEMSLSEEVVELVIEEFDNARSAIENDDDDLNEENVACELGQLNLSWNGDEVFERLALVMGFVPENELSPNQRQDLNEVFDAFFEQLSAIGVRLKVL